MWAIIPGNRLFVLITKLGYKSILADCETRSLLTEKNLREEFKKELKEIRDEIKKKLFLGLAPNSTEYLRIEIALRSSFDGLSDLKKWRSDGIVNDNVWFEIAKRLKL